MTPPFVLGILASSMSMPASYELITTRLVTSNLTAFTLSSIPVNTYKHLEVRYTARNGTATNGNLKMIFNSSATGYAFHTLYGDGFSVSASASTAQTYIELNKVVPGYTSTASTFGVGIISLLDYASTAKNKTIRAFAGDTINSKVGLFSGVWTNTAAITSMTFQMQNGTIGTGSRFSLYGIKG